MSECVVVVVVVVCLQLHHNQTEHSSRCRCARSGGGEFVQLNECVCVCQSNVQLLSVCMRSVFGAHSQRTNDTLFPPEVFALYTRKVELERVQIVLQIPC